MNMKGYKLQFISQINRDGSGTTKLTSGYRKLLHGITFKMNCLSITNGTWIACEFNSFVVKIRDRYK